MKTRRERKQRLEDPWSWDEKEYRAPRRRQVEGRREDGRDGFGLKQGWAASVDRHCKWFLEDRRKKGTLVV